MKAERSRCGSGYLTVETLQVERQGLEIPTGSGNLIDSPPPNTLSGTECEGGKGILAGW